MVGKNLNYQKKREKNLTEIHLEFLDVEELLMQKKVKDLGLLMKKEEVESLQFEN